MDHSSKNRYSCCQCGYHCVIPNQLKQHLLTHTREKLNTCSKCDFTSRQISEMKVHMAIHSDKRQFLCTECNGRFKKFTSLKRHLKMLHKNIKSSSSRRTLALKCKAPCKVIFKKTFSEEKEIQYLQSEYKLEPQKHKNQIKIEEIMNIIVGPQQNVKAARVSVKGLSSRYRLKNSRTNTYCTPNILAQSQKASTIVKTVCKPVNPSEQIQKSDTIPKNNKLPTINSQQKRTVPKLMTNVQIEERSYTEKTLDISDTSASKSRRNHISDVSQTVSSSNSIVSIDEGNCITKVSSEDVIKIQKPEIMRILKGQTSNSSNSEASRFKSNCEPHISKTRTSNVNANHTSDLSLEEILEIKREPSDILSIETSQIETNHTPKNIEVHKAERPVRNRPKVCYKETSKILRNHISHVSEIESISNSKVSIGEGNRTTEVSSEDVTKIQKPDIMRILKEQTSNSPNLEALRFKSNQEPHISKTGTSNVNAIHTSELLSEKVLEIKREPPDILSVETSQIETNRTSKTIEVHKAERPVRSRPNCTTKVSSEDVTKIEKPEIVLLLKEQTSNSPNLKVSMVKFSHEPHSSKTGTSNVNANHTSDFTSEEILEIETEPPDILSIEISRIETNHTPKNIEVHKAERPVRNRPKVCYKETSKIMRNHISDVSETVSSSNSKVSSDKGNCTTKVSSEDVTKIQKPEIMRILKEQTSNSPNLEALRFKSNCESHISKTGTSNVNANQTSDLPSEEILEIKREPPDNLSIETSPIETNHTPTNIEFHKAERPVRSSPRGYSYEASSTLGTQNLLIPKVEETENFNMGSLEFEAELLSLFHTRRQTHTCKICGLKFITLDGVKKHLTKCMINKDFKCVECVYICNSSDELRSHVTLTHKHKRCFSCRYCKFIFRDYDKYKTHVKKYYQKNYLNFETENKEINVVNVSDRNKTEVKTYCTEKVINSKFSTKERTADTRSGENPSTSSHSSSQNTPTSHCGEKNFQINLKLTVGASELETFLRSHVSKEGSEYLKENIEIEIFEDIMKKSEKPLNPAGANPSGGTKNNSSLNKKKRTLNENLENVKRQRSSKHISIDQLVSEIGGKSERSENGTKLSNLNNEGNTSSTQSSSDCVIS